MKSIGFLAIICLLGNNIYSQQSTFPKSDAQWLTAHTTHVCIGGSYRTYYWTEFLEGDTLLDNFQYAKLKLDPHCISANAGSHMCPAFVDYPTQGIQTVGGIREDSGRVYFKKFDVPNDLFDDYEKALEILEPGEEILLYDINWVAGDTVVYPFKSDSTLTFRVWEVEEVNGRKIFDMYLLRYPPWFAFSIVEGVGGTAGIFHMYYSNLTATEYYNWDVCAVQNGQVVFPGICGHSCGTVGTDDLQQPPLSFFPNPATDAFFISTDPISGPFSLNVYNSKGQKVYFDNTYEGNEAIPTEGLGKGIIFVSLTSNSGINRVGRLFLY